MTRSVFLLLCFTLIWPVASVLAVDRSADEYRDFRDELLELPYDAEIVPRLIPANKNHVNGGPAFLFVDLNGDGLDDLVRADCQGLVVADLADTNRTLARVELGPEYARIGAPAFALSKCPDLDQDGQPEIIAIGHTTDKMKWQMWVLDGQDLSILSTTSLPAGKDVRKDGHWDGNYRHAASLPKTAADDEAPLLILICTVGHDRDGRGVLGIDPRDGQISWIHEVAGVPRANSLVAGDFDGDGRNEIVFALELSNLPRGRDVNGYLENDSLVAVLNDDGSRRWSAVVSQGPGGCDVAVVDADQDGQPEVIASHWTTPLPSGGVHVWNLAGDLLDEYHSEMQLTGVTAIQSPLQDYPQLLVSTSLGVLEVLRFQDHHLARQWSLEFPYGCAVNGVLDLLPEEGPEIVVTDKSGRTVILSGAYQPLAQVVTSPLAWQGIAGAIRTADGQRELYRVGVREGTVAFRSVPRPVVMAYPVLAIVVVISTALIVMLWLGLRHRRRRLGPDIKHAVRLHLLESLQLSRHGDIAPLNSVRRLNFCLRALKSDIGDTSRVGIRLGEILTECQDASLPHLTGIMDRARLADMDSHTVKNADHDLATVHRLVQELAGMEDMMNPSEQLVTDLYKAEKDAERNLRRLRQEVAAYFQADPQLAIARVLVANQDRIRKLGIRLIQTEKAMAAGGGTDLTVDVPRITPPLPADTCCQIDAADLVQVLDNVIANAVASMHNTSLRQLGITQQLVDGMVLIDVTDSGCGIAPENRDRALNTHYTTKVGGGMGLPASRKILRRYSGQISILRSQPGRGTAVRITTIAC